ncbi:MAG TPA: DUF4143 domain-containing protein, partial [Burkholderiaceae bacterium]|nr:DUF4143 domain-containing protein [Burkholderiaceae bacterium]
FLAGLRGPGDLDHWPGRGRSFEGLVVEELIQRLSLHARRPYFAFWRTQAGAEVDLLFDLGRGLVPVEIKLGPVDRHGVQGLRHCMADLRLPRGYVVTASVDEPWDMGNGIRVLPWRDLARGNLPPQWLR